MKACTRLVVEGKDDGDYVKACTMLVWRGRTMAIM